MKKLFDVPHFLQKIFFQIIELLRKIYINFLGVDQTAGFIPESFLLLLAVFAKLHNFRRGVNPFSLPDHRDKKFKKLIGTAQNLCLFPGIHRIKDDHRFFRVKNLISQTDQVGLDLSGFFAVNTINSFISGICYLFCIFGKLDFGYKSITVSVFYCSKLVNSAKSRVVLAGDQIGSYAPGIDFCILSFQTVDQIFVQITGSCNSSVIKTGSSKHFVRFFGEIGKIAAVNTDAVFCQWNTLLSHFLKYTDGIGNT